MITRETVLALLPIFVGISVFFSLPSIKARLGLDKRPETPMISFTADDQECLMTANGVETRTPWTSIVNMTVTEEHVFLWLNRTSAIIIPLRAFPDAAAAQSFVELAEEKHVASAA